MESLHQRMCEGRQHMSESVFVGMCGIVGTSQQVAIRRETIDVKEMVERRLARHNGAITMMSGSYREGFRLIGSDIDWMFWLNDHQVIMDKSQSEYYNTANTIVILSDSSESPPGFTLLQLLTPSRYREVQSACVRMNDRVYISSSIYRQLTCSATHPNSTVHGPCASGDIAGRVEYDFAWCFVCDFWPPSASSWIDRCHSWPDPEVVDDIVRNGCHFVAIGHPLGPNENLQWRFSFSLAEYKLVYSMNHSQFLTYGLLKCFLKEVINQQSEETNKLLCSYHMKTTVFWAIQQNTLFHWCPKNLLAGFWVGFKLLLKWVYEGICPNFFIPQNNLFLTKVHGSAQNRLFLQLHELYKKGLVCLLQSSSIRSNIIDVLYNPRLSICTNENVMRSEVDFDLELVKQCVLIEFPITDFRLLLKAIRIVEQLINSPLHRYQDAILRKLSSSIFNHTAFI
ncbi:cyclic GMP-AMP synthase-like receptor 2 [Magallana gigas]|uniref:cyclic GMP-AMP synthase-like receptor 2 n=1 Tax=Magallana gigas TaxID=29159 RepID=UPI00334104C7